mmetsp:Transcript_32863/g.50973  ORF Transcript_32863/g.50973 Transcript_32863/m.50973 type:complete len:186 (+) Transcript_32863:194-751(+)|eukprot:CAMPEP_0117030392 /NCGR_PEP_ID=MMETSP0472-20121206/21939_1 /TAXON_ID=693140 ORGANISM="Tiarina fusus, Strain LIS" /NCGR_SAMPLE_ID=MMETSP0472 /ASSEMBLY_ACC=CAM_ASM_000603 /LENGTH=185 /DNA_ID=CAMNT_0004738449 /DNA_START=143 /DNA_END=700 /DNA_ORIENTATION=+
MDDDQIETAEEKGIDGVDDLLSGLNAAIAKEDAEVAESILDACLRMSSSTAVAAKLGNSNDTKVLTNVLTTFSEEAVVLEVLFAILVKAIPAAATSSQIISSFGTKEFIEKLFGAMVEHAEGEETLIEYACLVVERLAVDNNDAVGKLLLDAGAKERLDAAEEIITNVRNKKYVGQARKALKLDE